MYRRKRSCRAPLPRRGRDGLFLLLADQVLHPPQRIETGQPVGEEDAVEVVELVLERASRESRGLDPDLLAVAVAALDDDRLRPLDLAHPARVAEAALVAELR